MKTKLVQNVARSLLLFSILECAAPLFAYAQFGSGTALQFDGVNDYLRAPGFLSNAPTTEVTIEFWQIVNAVKNQSTFAASAFVATNVFNAHVPYSDGRVYWDFGNINTSGRLSYLPPVSLVGVGWQHFALVASQSGNFMRIYRNGILEAQKSGMTPYPGGNFDLTIGAFVPAALHFGGQLDEFRIWNVARSQTQIQENMNRSLPIPQANLTAYWRFDEAGGTETYDAGGNGKTAKLFNGPTWVTSTLPFAPLVTTLPASQVINDSATLNALVLAEGISATAWFQWGPTTNYGNITGSTNLSAGSNAIAIASLISGLLANETFNYRVVASNSFGLAYGENQESEVGGGYPSLNIARFDTNVVISWSANATSFFLESTTNLTIPIIWSAVSQWPNLLNGENVLMLAASDTSRFFRLRQGSSPAPSFNLAPSSNLGFESIANPSSGSGNDSSHSQGIGQVANAVGSTDGEVLLHNGEYVLHTVDLEIPGRGFNWKMEKTYRSGITSDGPLGHNWDFSFNRRLWVTNSGDVVRMDGYGRSDTYEYTVGGYLAPAGFYTQLTRQADGSFLERDRHGAKVYYSPTNQQGIARMTEIRDRSGNRMQLQYNSAGQLSRVLDTLGRAILYRYNSVTKRLIEVEDFAGRIIQYRYDGNGDLVAVTSPAVTGTPNGNNFPNGKTWHYAYASGLGDERLNHNLVSVTAPNEVAANGSPRILAIYETNTASPDVDRLIQLTSGGVNASGVPAGGTLHYQYQSLGSVPNHDYTTAVFQNTVTDRNGNQTEYQFNRIGNIVSVREFTQGLRFGEPAFYQTLSRFNSEGEMISRTNPLGNAFVYAYDSSNPDRFQQGNLLSKTQYPDAGRGADQTILRVTTTYEPVFNQVLTATSTRGNDLSYVPQNGGANTAGRYTTVYTYDYQEGQDFASIAAELGISQSAAQARLAGIPMNLGDVNGDAQISQTRGNRIRTTCPGVQLLPGSNQSVIEGSTQQPIVSLHKYNQRGQLIAERDPEGNVTQYTFYPEADPSGLGQFTPGVGVGPFGYLKQSVVDAVSAAGRDSGLNPIPAAIQTHYKYDAVGNITRMIDGRGIATDYSVNQLNQVVQTTRAAAHNLTTNVTPEPLPLNDFHYVARTFYDHNNRIVQQQVEDRGGTSGAGGLIDSLFAYDILGHVIQTTQRADSNIWLTVVHRYDANGNRTLTVQPEGNAVTARFDERNLLFQTIVGASNSAPGTLGAVAITSSRSGVPSTHTLNYDPNGNIIEEVDAADKDGSAANNSTIAGVGDVTKFAYDGFDRLTNRVDAVGNQTLYKFDPAGNVVQTTQRGRIGGLSPLNNVGVGNVDLSRSEFKFDELNRLFQMDRPLFLATGLIPQRTASIHDGLLTPDDGNRVTTRYEYDRNSRRTFTVDDNINTARMIYDGANRLLKSVDPENNTSEPAYDGNGNTIEVRETDVAQKPGISNEVFLTTFYYDSLNRLQRQVDNLGQTIEYRYDSRNNLVAVSDANGPITGSITRRAFSNGTLTVNSINGFGNVTLYSYDALNRLVREDRVMTASGKGDGLNIGADIFGIKTTTPPPDLTQAGGDGLITARYEYDGNSLLSRFTDDNGNQTEATYDNHNRTLSETRGICGPLSIADRCDPPRAVSYRYNLDGNRTRTTDENGSIVNDQFDGVGRLVSRSVTRDSKVVGSTAETYQYDGLHRMVRGTDNSEPGNASDDSVVVFIYDSLGRTIEENQQIGSTPIRAVSSAWRADTHRSALIYPNDRTVTNVLDRLNRLASIGDTNSAQPIATYSYIGRTRLTEKRYPRNNGLQTYLNDSGLSDAGYDGLRRPIQLRHFTGTNAVAGFNYAYDRAGNLLAERKLHAVNESELSTLDSGYRMLQFNRGTLNSSNTSITIPSPNAPAQTNWIMDGMANWRSVSGEVRLHNSFNEIIQRSNAVTTVILSDRNGNQTDNGVLTYQFDYRNRLRNVTRKSDNQPLAVYSYDACNRRTSKTVTNSGVLNGNTLFYYDGSKAIEERAGANLIINQYVFGGSKWELLALDRNLNGDATANGDGDRRVFYHRDSAGSVFAGTDLTGQIVEAYQYDAYGQRTVFGTNSSGVVAFHTNNIIASGASAIGNNRGFKGTWLDLESGLIYNGTTFGDTVQGRTITQSPLDGIIGRLLDGKRGPINFGQSSFSGFLNHRGTVGAFDINSYLTGNSSSGSSGGGLGNYHRGTGGPIDFGPFMPGSSSSGFSKRGLGGCRPLDMGSLLDIGGSNEKDLLSRINSRESGVAGFGAKDIGLTAAAAACELLISVPSAGVGAPLGFAVCTAYVTFLSEVVDAGSLVREDKQNSKETDTTHPADTPTTPTEKEEAEQQSLPNEHTVPPKTGYPNPADDGGSGNPKARYMTPTPDGGGPAGPAGYLYTPAPDGSGPGGPAGFLNTPNPETGVGGGPR